MSVPSLPDWMPWWVPIIVMVPLGLWALTMLLMPFSVIGLKSRLEGIEAHLDEVQSEIRSLVLRLPESPAERMSYRDEYYRTAPASLDRQYVQPEPVRPPIPPAPTNDFIPRRPDRITAPESPAKEGPREEWRTDRPAPSPRAEPRMDWRR